MNALSHRPPRRILIASANPLFSKGLQGMFSQWWTQPVPEMRLSSSMADTVDALQSWMPDLVVVDYDDQNINRAEFLNHYVASDVPMQVMLVSLQESGEVVVYDRRTMTPAEVQTWFQPEQPRATLPRVAAAPAARSDLLRPRWVILTLLVLLAVGVFIRLGFWQLERLAERRARNAQIQTQSSLPPLDLNQHLPAPADLAQMEYRMVTATGVFDPAGEVLLSNQPWQGRLGVHLLTPLRLEDGQTLLVDRGWIPYEERDAQARQKYAQPGTVTVTAMLRASQSIRGQGQNAPGAFTQVNIDLIRQSTGQELLPLYAVQAPNPATSSPPYRVLPEVELTEGPHLGYALQWFFFALVLVVGFPIFLRKQIQSLRGEREGHTLNGGSIEHKNV